MTIFRSNGFTSLKLALLAAAVLGILPSSTAVADPAIVIKDDGLCGMLGADANGNAIFGGIGTVETYVQNDNKVTIQCKGTGLPNLSGSGQAFRDFQCGIVKPDGNFYLTTDSHATVSESGVGMLSCTYDL